MKGTSANLIEKILFLTIFLLTEYLLKIDELIVDDPTQMYLDSMLYLEYVVRYLCTY